MSVEVTNLSFGYSNKKVLREFSEKFEDGQCTAVVGKNGAGKSTLLKLLVGILRPSAGEILIDGGPLWRARHLRKPKVRDDHASLIGYVMQKPERQLFAQSVFEDVAFGPRNLGLDESVVSERVNRWLDYFNIASLAEKSPYKISGGQQRMVAIAGVMAMETQNICFDEPSASLDSDSVKKIQHLIEDLKDAGKCVILVSHDRVEVDLLANRIVEIERGA